jgi:hypothetical protein
MSRTPNTSPQHIARIGGYYDLDQPYVSLLQKDAIDLLAAAQLGSHWITSTIAPLERDGFFGTVTLRFRDGTCYQLDETRTRKPPKEAEERPEENTE